jgi:hypothetical protein
VLSGVEVESVGKVNGTVLLAGLAVPESGVTIPFVGEENVVVAVVLVVLEVVIGMELEATIDLDDVVDVVTPEVESDEDVEDKI